jgi:hypothetical protein
MQRISLHAVGVLFVELICMSALTACGGQGGINNSSGTENNGSPDTTSKFVLRQRGPDQIATRASTIASYNSGAGSAPIPAPTIPVSGVCGTSNNVIFSSAPTSGLCSTGTASVVSGTGPWTWSCASPNGGATTNCATNGAVVLQSSYTSSAANVEIPQLCSGTKSFPSEWTWDPAKTVNQPRAAMATDNLTPKIEQVRNGQVIATYTSFGSNTNTCTYTWPTATVPMDLTAYAAAGCGPFGNVSHVDLFRIAQNGDTFLVYPAVYTGSQNNIFIAPKPDYYLDPVPHIPANITIQGVTQNGIRPVLLDVVNSGDFASNEAPVYIWNGGVAGQNAANIVIQNIDLAVDKNIGFPGKAGIYTNGAASLTLRQMRVHGFEQVTGDTYGANGIFTTGADTGTLTLDQIELYDNGGGNGPAHNIYVNTSLTDPNYTVHMLNSWSHDAFYGHTFKSRAQINILEGNYFQGGLPQGGIYTQAENYLVDISNGGILTMHNNILVKNASGANSNGASVTFDPEGLSDDLSPVPRTYSVDIENNTFVALASTYDGSHPIWPLFFWNQLVPGTAGFEVPTLPSGYVVPPVVVAKNVYIGYCPQTYPSNLFMNYQGGLALTEAFSQLNLDFSLTAPMVAIDTSVAGTPAYLHAAQTGLTRQGITSGSTYLTIGAEDN